MADEVLRYPSWQKYVQEILKNLPPDSAERVQRMRLTLEARLRIMTTADLEERRALEDALEALQVLKARRGAAFPLVRQTTGGNA